MLQSETILPTTDNRRESQHAVREILDSVSAIPRNECRIDRNMSICNDFVTEFNVSTFGLSKMTNVNPISTVVAEVVSTGADVSTKFVQVARTSNRGIQLSQIGAAALSDLQSVFAVGIKEVGILKVLDSWFFTIKSRILKESAPCDVPIVENVSLVK